MSLSVRWVPFRALSVNFMLLGSLFIMLWIAGGASRADAPGQLVVRGSAWVALIAAILFGARPSLRGTWPVLLGLLAALLLVCLQLLPLPPAVWQALPGRVGFADAAVLSGQAQPWRPIAIVPASAINAASSLVVPFAVLLLAAGSAERERACLPGVVLGLVAASALLGLLQFSGAGFDNPLTNDSPGQVSGSFANRNHFALFLAMGSLIAPAWAFADDRRPGWRLPVALGLVLLFALIILATGSRAGILVGMLSLLIGLLFARQGIGRRLERAPRWMFSAIVAGIIGTITIVVLLSVAADRAMSLERVFTMNTEQDMRARSLPTVLAMIGVYFPIGSGFGGFEPMFRMYEPLNLLELTYFNHAHNDFLEIALDGGLAGVVLLSATILWWAFASVRAWRSGPGSARLGSAMLLLLLVASLFDYPARTPMMMAMIVVAGIWLSGATDKRARVALPPADQHL